MTYDPWRTRLRVVGVPISVGSYIGIKEVRTEIEDVVKKRDVNGGQCILEPLWYGKFKIAFSASGPAVRRVPPFERLRKTQVVEIHSTLHMSDWILPGQPSVTLIRMPVPGSIKVFRTGDRWETPIPFTVLDRMVTPTVLATEELTVKFAPIHFATRNSSTGSGDEITGYVDWATEFEET